MGIQIGSKVERVDGRRLSYRDFIDRYLKKNLPVVLTGLMDGWQACTDWVTADGRPNLRFFTDHFGKSIVQVADCRKRDFTDQKRVEMSVSEYVDYWLGISSIDHNKIASSNGATESLLYLKDWHFVKEYPNYVAYTTPSLFADDWLNLYLDSHCLHRDSDITRDKNEINCADYRFVYMGVKGTWTPLHADVFMSYSWSANVCGTKLWLFLPPSQCHLIFDRYLKNSVYDVYGEISEKMFPGFNKAIWWDCTQEQNEIIFVPSGWYHQVHNLEDTISINHNWFNGYNLFWVWNLLVKDYTEAKEYIEDIREICDDFESICQRNLAANTGMNFYDFFVFITRFALANLVLLRDLKNEEIVVSHLRSVAYYVSNNIKAIHSVALSMGSVEAFADQNLNSCSEENRIAYSEIKRIMEEPDFHELYTALRIALQIVCEGHHQDYNLGTALKKIDLCSLSDFKIGNPTELVKLIENVFQDQINMQNGCNIGFP
ncbi:jmjC domain-containing protein 4 isoform X2 [Phalaenopsis equestris]|uniref:jmjC domain-containing protein 4 isoform X1 n=1 Tax=Phalaenopsis equestris TaxID=78828 RepID=UPI0009E3A652|nr:jmjC domain-containing protein 4 isoform X1 [Phalaenopsis equestris]XP_020584963.1 jmjC domain-containing protein 4 isoform X2 [Phalaenopsis equestris]